jgi:cyclopropane-fatty-acyl-phospholipid synthase
MRVSTTAMPQPGDDPSLVSAPFFARQALRIVKAHWCFGQIEFHLPNAQTINIMGKKKGPRAHLKINDYGFMRRILANGDIGFFEGYRAGEWESHDLFALLEAFSLNLDALKVLQDGNILMRLYNGLVHALRANTKAGSRKNILAHYDLGNDFYAQWLDPSMTYSSALFDRPNDLETAQWRKYEALAQMIDLKAGQDVLEIGCGWGGFAHYAAQTVGAKVTCVTISQAQFDYATARMKNLGLSDKVTILLMDYRDIKGQFDAVVSIEMFEAVGEAYWPVYFEKIRACLKPKGRAGLQIISIRDDLFEDYRSRTDFIQKYVFPGGMLPSMSKLSAQIKLATLTTTGCRHFAKDYAVTLRLWADRFEAAWAADKISGFDVGFKRLWLFYLAYCAAGFASGRTDVVQIGLTRG